MVNECLPLINMLLTSNSRWEKKLHLLLIHLEVVVAFSSLARILGECLTIHSLHVPLLLSFFLFFKVEISLRTLNPLFVPRSVHSV